MKSRIRRLEKFKLVSNGNITIKIPFLMMKGYMEDLIMWQPDLYLHTHPKMVSYLLIKSRLLEHDSYGDRRTVQYSTGARESESPDRGEYIPSWHWSSTKGKYRCFPWITETIEIINEMVNNGQLLILQRHLCNAV